MLGPTDYLPPTAVVFEVDQPQVIAFKAKVLADMGVSSRAEGRLVRSGPAIGLAQRVPARRVQRHW